MLHLTTTHSLSSFRDLHIGERCVIVGNGPSLNDMDLSPLAREWVIGTNYAFIKPEIKSKYICISDTFRMQELELYENNLHDKVIFYNSHRDDKTQIWSIPAVLEAKTIILQRIGDDIGFSWDVEKGVYVNFNMASVVFPAIQLAVYMGAQEIYLIGVDQDYSGKQLWFHGKEGVPHRELVNMDRRQVIGHSFTYTYEARFKPAIIEYHRILGEKGIGLYNATVGGKLDHIPRVDFAEVFKAL